MQTRTPGLVIRPAQAGEAARLVEVERDSPVPAGGGVTFTVEKPDALGLSRLQPEPVVLVAEIDGRVVGMNSASIHDGLIGGQRQRMGWLHYPRVLPDYRGKWIGHSLATELTAVCRERADRCYQLFMSGYDAEDGRHRWRTQPVWLLLDSGRIGGPPHGRPATPDDAELVVEMLNAGHAREELFLPYTVASLTARLERSPTQYSWADLTIGDGAVTGVWRGAWRLVRNHHSRIVRGIQDNVLDYGFLPGAEGELLRLLRAAGGRATNGTLERYLGMWTSVGSPAYPSLTVLTGREFPFQLQSDAPEPPAASHRGLHLDALHST